MPAAGFPADVPTPTPAAPPGPDVWVSVTGSPSPHGPDASATPTGSPPTTAGGQHLPGSSKGDRPGASLDVDQRLWALVDGVDAALHDLPAGEGVVLGLLGPGEGRGLGGAGLLWLPLDGRHPLDVLLGFRAPDDWLALGLCCSGRSSPLDGAGHAPAGDDRPAVRVTSIIDRDGRSASVLRTGPRPVPLGEAPQGAVGDSLRRALGLPTAPVTFGTAALWTTWWLDRVAQAALAARPAGAGTPPEAQASWASVAALHPACPFTLPGAAPCPSDLVDATFTLSGRWTWARLRTDPEAPAALARPAAAAATGPSGVPGAPSVEAACWMDDGMFARWLLAGFPPLADLLDMCHHLLPTAVAARVVAVATSSLRADVDEASAQRAGGA